MIKFIAPESWGEFESQAKQSFGHGRDDVLELLHVIQSRLSWAKEDRFNLIYCAGWLDGVLHAQRELERAQKYPDTLRDIDSMLDDVGSSYQLDLETEGRKMGIQVDFSSRHNNEKILPQPDIYDALCTLLDQDIYPRSVPIAMFILFSTSINPNSIYYNYIDGFSSGYTVYVSKNMIAENKISRFLPAKIPGYHENFFFINNYIFESENTDLIINAKLFMNPLREKSILRLINEDDNSVVAEIDVENRVYNELSELNGQEEDYLKAGGLLLNSLSGGNNKVLQRQISQQAAMKIVSIVADDLSVLINDVFDKPFIGNVKRLKDFVPITTQYINFIPPNGYDDLIKKILQYISPINDLSDVFFTELNLMVIQLRKISGL